MQNCPIIIFSFATHIIRIRMQYTLSFKFKLIVCIKSAYATVCGVILRLITNQSFVKWIDHFGLTKKEKNNSKSYTKCRNQSNAFNLIPSDVLVLRTWYQFSSDTEQQLTLLFFVTIRYETFNFSLSILYCDSISTMYECDQAWLLCHRIYLFCSERMEYSLKRKVSISFCILYFSIHESLL